MSETVSEPEPEAQPDDAEPEADEPAEPDNEDSEAVAPPAEDA